MHGACLLCQTETTLQLSHVIPAFVYRWLKDTGSGYIRTGDTINQRVQDGPKEYWLCSSCEELFSRYETAFANQIFHPYLENPQRVLPYKEWLLKFCTSVSWRVLHLLIRRTRDHDHDPEILKRLWAAEEVWREFLLGHRPHPGKMQQHVIPVEKIQSTNMNLAPNINRYLLRGIHMNFFLTESSIYTYSKMGRFIIIGFVSEPNPAQWTGTKVHATMGFIEPKEYVVPKSFGDYINAQSNRVFNDLGQISDRQRAKINENILSKADSMAGSDAHRALQADVKMFGSKAYSNRSKET